MKKIIFLTLISIQLYSGQIVVNAKNPLNTLSAETIKEIFTLRKLTWDNGDPIIVYMLPSASLTQNALTSTYLSMNADEYHETWMQYILNGGMNKPPIFLNERRLIKQLKRHSNAIGIVSDKVKLPAQIKAIYQFNESN